MALQSCCSCITVRCLQIRVQVRIVLEYIPALNSPIFSTTSPLPALMPIPALVFAPAFTLVLALVAALALATVFALACAFAPTAGSILVVTAVAPALALGLTTSPTGVAEEEGGDAAEDNADNAEARDDAPLRRPSP
ncbi:uncharacterized protein EDB91DRAFT_1257006 [Suillus paluster]|uniref:uncharacterized protein n=1 Tax=Suillus paluster TaxID=48578 RepID=UPI001B87E9F8|nr:uncharacterized protein EDB91DRAFT_1257006 [Suillus paluster]KAG0692767.1 hypothetical protein DFH29DRAFT_1008159 [Suillus ampliporus]KAG1720416.1 hypothetical protein EDB91DRAFT_1257006 [Suillus paluster]